jgi:SAM-dependent methyltransferase
MIGVLISWIRTSLTYIRFYGGYFRCNVCKRPVRRFFPFSKQLLRTAKEAGFPYDFRRMETLNFDNCNCPFCLSSDRERLYLLFLHNYLQECNTLISILDFAPNAAFSRALKKVPMIEYASADLYRDDMYRRLDICSMSTVEDNTFDILICSHILEHVDHPEKALSEIYRVLKATGIAIIMVPLFWDVKGTVENKHDDTDQSRARYYGQNDHVRLFSRNDFLNRISGASFLVREWNTTNFKTTDVRRLAIAGNSILYICSKT